MTELFFTCIRMLTAIVIFALATKAVTSIEIDVTFPFKIKISIKKQGMKNEAKKKKQKK